MADLLPSPPLDHPPLSMGSATLAVAAPGPITSIALYPGGNVDKALKPLGLAFPAPNRFTESGAARLVWTSRDQAFLIGAPAPSIEAALTDQTDGWAAFTLDGQGAEAVLARLVALDLRAAAFPQGHAARSGLNHLPMVLLRTGAEAFLILTFRSMARTAWHELEAAMTGIAARAAC